MWPPARSVKCHLIRCLMLEQRDPSMWMPRVEIRDIVHAMMQTGTTSVLASASTVEASSSLLSFLSREKNVSLFLRARQTDCQHLKAEECPVASKQTS